MEVKYHEERIPFVVIDDLYDDKEQSEIMVELDYLCTERRLIPPFKDKNGASDEYRNIKNVGCLYLDNFYKKRRHSSILQITEKLFMDDASLISNHPHWYFDISSINSHSTHILYYEDSNEYPAHRDECRFTAVTYFYRQPKKFEGGDLQFSDHQIEVECVNNRIIVFPSMLFHRSTPVRMLENDTHTKNGKFCITQFLDHK